MNIIDTVQELAKSQAVQMEILERLETGVNGLYEHLLGNGKPGLIVRVDRLEVWDKMKNKVLWLLLGVVTTGAAGWVFGRF